MSQMNRGERAQQMARDMAKKTMTSLQQELKEKKVRLQQLQQERKAKEEALTAEFKECDDLEKEVEALAEGLSIAKEIAEPIAMEARRAVTPRTNCLGL